MELLISCHRVVKLFHDTTRLILNQIISVSQNVHQQRYVKQNSKNTLISMNVFNVLRPTDNNQNKLKTKIQ